MAALVGMVGSLMMTKARHREVTKYIYSLQELLALKDWTVELSFEEPDEESTLGSTTCTYGRKNAIIRVAPEFHELSLYDQRHIIVHELLHCHLARMRYVVINLKDHLSSSVFSLAFDSHMDELEFTVDAMADALAPKCPLPEWA